MPGSKKVEAALARRKKAFIGRGPCEKPAGQKAVMPGSQNRKKGSGMKRGKTR